MGERLLIQSLRYCYLEPIVKQEEVVEAQKTQRQRVLTIDDSNWFGFPLYSNLRTLKLNNFIYFKVVLIISI